MRLLLVAAVPAEVDAIAGALREPAAANLGPYAASAGTAGGGEAWVLAAGVGAAAAAAATATALAASGPWDAVLSVGIAGGFPGRAAIGDVVVATAALAAELGAEFPDGFRGLTDLGVPGDRFACPLAEPLTAGLRRGSTAPVTGPVLTVSTVTGTAARAAALSARHAPVAEAMEGSGVATAAAAFGVPFGELRTVSNVVGECDRSRWEIGRALGALRAAARALFEEPPWTR
ncbi:MAG TPA: futalosine hydrolase [Mycobacteriales bacterium]|nr:futalosine hydrolase [Mycobacteriales bacterium]